MPLLPKKHAERIAFFTTRNALWNTNVTAIGTSTSAVTALATAISAAATALAAKETAQNAAKAATETLKLAMETMTNQAWQLSSRRGPRRYPLANILCRMGDKRGRVLRLAADDDRECADRLPHRSAEVRERGGREADH